MVRRRANPTVEQVLLMEEVTQFEVQEEVFRQGDW
jgi:hypothetical protein